MAKSNRDRVGAAMEHLKTGLYPFIERELTARYNDEATKEAREFVGHDRTAMSKDLSEWDVQLLLKLMWGAWNAVFRDILGPAERSLVSELRDARNKWAHQEPFSSDDADRALDSMQRLLTAVTAPEADDVNRMKMELRRLIFDEQARHEKRKKATVISIEKPSESGLKPWREIIMPHKDVAGGKYQQAEFAADLWQVHLGDGPDEYQNPQEFFRRTYLTESLKNLLIRGVQRLSGTGGDPVVQLQTNFGGGKTHSMLALFHLFSGASPSDLAGVDAVMAESDVKILPKANRVVLVGNKISPGNPVKKSDGTVVRTLWGELGYQLGGKKAFARVKADDENATNPGDVLRQLFKEYGPCLILIDEWVAYARQLHDQSDLPAGGFETQFSFAQALTESAKLAGNCLLVISLPASDTNEQLKSHVDDVEVGGVRGREALDRLRNVVGRLESSWRPASAEEGFEIVRRRLFEPINDPEDFKQRDVTARAFSELYRSQSAEFPSDCKKADYERRIKAAFPIHPEIFDQLYGVWSTLVKFQRTRGVLRLMAAVIHSLWEKGDRGPLIMPSTVPIDDARVQSELTRYLSDNWSPIIERDVDGPNSLPLRIDGEQPNLGKLGATRRVARTIYLGSAPAAATSHHGIEDQRVKLGCVMPGESPAIFGDALRRLASAATYLYQDGPRFWYSTQPTVTKLAEDRAEQLKRDPDKIANELDARLRVDLKNAGDFSRVHILPASGADVPDDYDARLVVLSADFPCTKEEDNPAVTAAKAIYESRGSSPRLYRNTLVFLAADKVRLQDLEEALRKYLAWESIVNDKAELELTPSQVKQAENQMQSADSTVAARLPETYQCLIYPDQPTYTSDITWETARLTGREPLAVRVSKKLGKDYLIKQLGSTILRMHLDNVPLWKGDHIEIRELIDYFARYVYLPRLIGPEVLIQTIMDGVSLLTWSETFAYAESYDESKQTYAGLRAGQNVTLTPDSNGLLVKPDVARRQFDKVTAVAGGNGSTETGKKTGIGSGSSGTTDATDGESSPDIDRPETETQELPKRYHGSVRLDPERVGRDAGNIAQEIIAFLVGQVDADVTVTLEIEAHLPHGASEHVVRTVTENSNSLKFDSHGFEKE